MIVVDASVAIKWIREEKDRDKAIILHKDHLEKREEIIVPQLLYYEVANTLATKFSLTNKIIKRGLDFIFGTTLVIYLVDREDILQASSLASEYKSSFYDMLYAVVAKKHKTILVTADERFVRVTKFSYVKLLGDYTRSSLS